MVNSVIRGRRGQHGFTLIELMIAVAVVGILAAIATAVYTAQIQKARRTDARNALLDLAGREERFFSVANSYSQTPADVGYTAFPQIVGSGYYQVNVAVAAAAPPLPPSYTITAIPLGTQQNDTTCAVFSINQIGQQSSQNSGGADTTATCWGS
jgi:type IV pilus assembly protein PilE